MYSHIVLDGGGHLTMCVASLLNVTGTPLTMTSGSTLVSRNVQLLLSAQQKAAWVMGWLVIEQGSQVTIEGISNFTVRQFSSRTSQRFTMFSMRPQYLPLSSPRTPIVEVQCMLWMSGVGVTCDDINAPWWMINMTPSVDSSASGKLIHCDGSCYPTSTVSATIIDDADDDALPPVVPLAAAAAAGMAAAASVVAALGALAGSVAAMDVQVLAALGMSPCASELGEASSASRFVVSPFYALGPLAMVLGNAGLALAVLGAHRAFVAQLAGAPQHAKLPPPKALDAACVAARYPHHSLVAGSLLLPGIAQGGARAFSGAAEEVVGGVVALVVVGVAVWLRLGPVPAHRNARRLTFRRYTPREVADVARKHGRHWARVPAFALPLGRWMPPACHATHGRLRSAVRDGVACVRLSELSLVYGTTMNALGGLPVTGAVGCTVLLSAACAVPLLAALATAVWRPGRNKARVVLQLCHYVLIAAAVGLTGWVRHDATDLSLPTAIRVCSLGVTVVSLLVNVHVALVFVWERHFLPVGGADLPTEEEKKLFEPTLNLLGSQRSVRSKLHLNLSSSVGLHNASSATSSSRPPPPPPPQHDHIEYLSAKSLQHRQLVGLIELICCAGGGASGV